MLKKIGLVLLNLFVILLILEAILRLYAAWYRYSLNQLYRSEKKDTTYKIKILAVGESTTAGLWVENRSYPIQLKEKLERYYNCRGCVEMNILTLPGNTSGTLHELPSYILKYKPNVVIFMVGFNDFAFYEYNIDALLLENFFTKNKVVYYLYLHSVKFLNEILVFRVAKLTYVSLTMPRSKYLDTNEIVTRHGLISAERARFSDLKPIERFIENQMKNNIEKMIEITQLNDATPMLMTHPVCRTNYIIREVANGKGVALIDNEVRFNKLQNYADYFFKESSFHPNAKGYEIIAQDVMNYLLKWVISKR